MWAEYCRYKEAMQPLHKSQIMMNGEQVAEIWWSYYVDRVCNAVFDIHDCLVKRTPLQAMEIIVSILEIIDIHGGDYFLPTYHDLKHVVSYIEEFGAEDTEWEPWN